MVIGSEQEAPNQNRSDQVLFIRRVSGACRQCSKRKQVHKCASANRGSQVKYVEVKGTQTTGRAFVLTAREVAFIQHNSPNCVLFTESGLVAMEKEHPAGVSELTALSTSQSGH